MKVDDNPFPGDQNMVDARLLKGKNSFVRMLISSVHTRSLHVEPIACPILVPLVTLGEGYLQLILLL